MYTHGLPNAYVVCIKLRQTTYCVYFFIYEDLAI